jgi:hypothetical protein
MTQINKKKLSTYTKNQREVMIPELKQNFTRVDVLPVTMPNNALVMYRGTLYRGLGFEEIFGINFNTPFPVKGYRELILNKSHLGNFIDVKVNDFGFNFEIRNDSPGIYVISQAGGLPIYPLAGDPVISLFLSFSNPETPDSTYSFSYHHINVGEDTGKIKLVIMKHDESGNDLANTGFTLRLLANYNFNFPAPIDYPGPPPTDPPGENVLY